MIHEETGQELSGTYIAGQASSISKVAFGNPADVSVDVSGLPDGQLIVIANILDEDGKIETSKSIRINKGGGPTSVSGITAPHNKIVLNGRTVTVFSTSEGFITIATIDGTQRIQPVVNGKTTFELPQAGLYIIDGRKFIVR